MKHEKANSRALRIQNKEYNKLIIKQWVDPNDKEAIKTVLQNTKSEVKSLRNKLKIPGTKHDQTIELDQVENEKELLIGELVDKIKRLLFCRNKCRAYNSQIKTTFTPLWFHMNQITPQINWQKSWNSSKFHNLN